jgi:uncharacterized membrane protein
MAQACAAAGSLRKEEENPMRLASLLVLGTFFCASQADAAFFGIFGNSVENVVAQNGMIAIDASTLPKMAARHYRYQEGSRAVKFFVVRDGQGALRAAVDACEVCWREGKGYVLQEGAMLCVNCGRKFPMSRIGLVAGGCNPHPFQFKVENGSVLIEAQELAQQGTRYFPEKR